MSHRSRHKSASVGTSLSPSRKPKRTRVSQACDQCRAEKDKCDGGRPSCHTCLSTNQTCTYEREVRKRGPRTGSARAIECTLAWVFDEIPGAEERAAAMLASEKAQGLLAGRSSEDWERLHQKWTSCRVNTRIQRILSGRDAEDRESPEEDVPWSVQQQDTARPPPSDTTSPQNLLIHSPSHTPQDQWQADSLSAQQHSMWTPDSTLLSTQGDVSFASKPDLESWSLDELSRRRHPSHSASLSLPPNHDHLLQIYFSYTHSWFPILDRTEIIEATSHYPIQDFRTLLTTPQHAELWSAMAIAAFQDLASKSSNQSSLSLNSTSVPPSEVYAVARRLLPADDVVGDTGHVNALLLLSLVNIGQSRNDRASLLIGSAINKALNLGLHHRSFSDEAGSFRKQHTLAACFMLETLICAITGRVRHLRTTNLASQLPYHADLVDECEPWSPVPGVDSRPELLNRFPPAQSYSAFRQLYRFFQLLNDAIEQPLRESKQALTALAQSVDYAFSSCNSIAVSPSDIALPSTFMVHATFLTVGMFLKTHRASIHLLLFLEHLETHLSCFGSAMSSPLLVGYMNLARQQPLFPATDDAFLSNWNSAANTFGLVWGFGQSNENMTGHMALQWQGSSQRGDSTGRGPTSAPSVATLGLGQPTRYAPMQVFPHTQGSLSSGPTDLQSLATMHSGQMTSIPSSASPVTVHTSQKSRGGVADGPQEHAGGGPSAGGAELDAALAEIAEIGPFNNSEFEKTFLDNLGFVSGGNMNDLMGMDYMP